MKVSSNFLLLLLMFVFATMASADEIHMVNGSTYSVQSWKFEGDYLTMKLTDGRTLRVSRDHVKKISIDKVEKDPEVTRVTVGPPTGSNRITYSVSRDLALPESVLGHMNSKNFAAALLAMENTDQEYKDSVDYHFLKGSILMAAGQFAEANAIVSARMNESSAFPGSKYTFALSNYFLGHISEAIKIVESIGLEEVPRASRNNVMQTYKELEILAGFRPVSSISLTVLVDRVLGEGPRISNGLETMERSFSKLGKMLNYLPPQPVLVVVTDNIRFSAGENLGSYDGKVVIPGSVLGTEVEEEIIIHELTHSFILSKTRGNCPVWLHEGLAQTLSGKSIDEDMEPFIIFINSNRAMGTYHDSLATIEYLLNSYGMEQINQLLGELEAGIYPTEAVKLVFEKSYLEILQDRNRWLQRKLVK